MDGNRLPLAEPAHRGLIRWGASRGPLRVALAARISTRDQNQDPEVQLVPMWECSAPHAKLDHRLAPPLRDNAHPRVRKRIGGFLQWSQRADFDDDGTNVCGATLGDDQPAREAGRARGIR